MPAVTACPACQLRQLYVYRDAIFGGEWLHCRNCDYHGDIVEVAAHTWKLDVWHAAVKLAGFPQVVVPGSDPMNRLQGYLQLVERRKQVDKFWETSREQLGQLEDGDLREILTKHSVMRSLTAGDWHRTGARLVGVASREQIEQAFKHRQHHRYNVLKGPGWKYLMTLPFYDLPGRLCGFLFVGREGKPADHVYHKIYAGHPDAGIGLLPAILGKVSPDFSGHVYHFTDTRLGLRLQMRWLRSSETFLPVVLTRPETKGTTWEAMAPRQHVLCTPKMTSDIIRQARTVKGRVNVSHPGHDDEYTRSPAYWLKRNNREAKPWRTKLEQQLRQISAEQCNTVLTDLGLSREELVEFIRTCDPQLRQKLNKTMIEQQSFRQVQFRSYTVTESSQGWAVKGVPICNGIVHLDQILRHDDKRYYRGYVRIGKEEIRFVDDCKTVKRCGLLARAAHFAEAAGQHLTYDPGWNRHAEQLATLLHPPRVVISTNRIGWDSNLNGFRLAHFNLVAGGRVERDDTNLFAEDRIPTQRMLPPTAMLEKTVKSLCRSIKGREFFWTTFAAVVQHILAPAFRTTPAPLVIVGKATVDQVVRHAGCMGCETYETGQTAVLTRATNHHWPAVIRVGDRRLDTAWLRTARNCLAELPAVAVPLATLHGWDTLNIPDDTLPLQIAVPELQTVLPLYLQDLCRRNMTLTTPTTGFTGVLEDVIDWISRTWGHHEMDVAEISKPYTPATPLRRAAALRSLVTDAISIPGAILTEGQHTLLSQQHLQALNLPLGYKLDVYDTTLLLRDAGLLCSDVERPGYWAVHPSWWTSSLQKT